MTWRGELDRWRRFGLQLVVAIVSLGGVALLVVAALGIKVWLTEPPKGGVVDRTLAVWEALGMSQAKSGDDQLCKGSNISNDNKNCFALLMQGQRYCRWWMLETCQPFTISDLALSDPDKLGKVLHAALEPCSYLTRLDQFPRSALNQYCHPSDKMPLSPIVIIFRGRDRDVTLRID